MKAAMWGVGLIVFGLFGLVLINLFGNITVTNQFNYTTMKNSVQAAMYDSLDVAHYRAGFCLCPANSSDDATFGTEQKVFTNKNQYTLANISKKESTDSNTSYENETTTTNQIIKEQQRNYSIEDLEDGRCQNNCVALYGEYILDADKFVDNLKQRFSSMVTNSKKYDYIIKEIIAYPPKVSVRIVSHDDEFSPTEKNSEGYDIVNQIDAIIETDNEPYISIMENSTERLVCEMSENPACYKDPEGSYVWGKYANKDGYTLVEGITSADECKMDEPTTDEPTPSNPTDNRCYWFYKNNSTTCKSKNACKDTYGTTNNPTKDLKDGCTVIGAPIKDSSGELEYRYKCTTCYDKTFGSNSLSDKAKKSGSNYISAKRAINACNSAQTTFCKSKKDTKGDKYTGYSSNGCKAYQNYKYLGKNNGKDKCTCVEVESGTELPSCESKGFDASCSRQCVNTCSCS